jgi:predicted regulator of Ras-like GTPase activity (Roadblock/LC7/MglB family)
MQALPMQQAALQQLASVPGVVGSLVFDRRGGLVASEFPAVFDDDGLRQLAGQLAGDGYFQEWLTGDQALLDLRYADGSVVVRPVDDTWLMVLCTPQANPQLLSMSLTQVARRLRLGAAGGGGARPAEPAPPAAPPAAPSRLDRLKAIVSAELGGHAAQALEILAVAGPSPADLKAAAADIEKLTRLFINKKKAEEIGKKLRDVIG